MNKPMTYGEWLIFCRDAGRPPDDFETMYRQPVEREAQMPTADDAVSPLHYKIGGIEAIDYMRAKSTPEEFEGYLRLSTIKYLSRVGHKHGDHDAARAEEYRKAKWFLDRLVEEIER